MRKPTERFKHIGKNIFHGYCNICGVYSELKRDHVPPKCAITLEPFLQKTVTEFFHTQTPVTPVKAKTGAYFKTICVDCNSKVLGGLDISIKNVVDDFKDKLLSYIEGRQIYNIIKITVDSKSFTRAMIGHILSATSVDSCLNKPVDSPFYTPLQNYVLGKISSYEDTHDIYYWFYPHKMHISAQNVSFSNEGHVAFMCVLHFFPIGFIITKKDEGTAPKHATQLKLSDKHLFFNMTSSNLLYATFPFVPLKDNQMYVYRNGYTCVTYPQKN
jgi:hypothetical protein